MCFPAPADERPYDTFCVYILECVLWINTQYYTSLRGVQNRYSLLKVGILLTLMRSRIVTVFCRTGYTPPAPHVHICPVSVYFLPALMITFVNSKSRCMGVLRAVRAISCVCVVYISYLFYCTLAPHVHISLLSVFSVRAL